MTPQHKLLVRGPHAEVTFDAQREILQPWINEGLDLLFSPSSSRTTPPAATRAAGL